jgi:hypothetical protein
MPGRLIPAIATAGLMCGMQTPLRAAPPTDADPNLRPWFRSLLQPQTGLSCCDRSDCRTVRYRIVNSHFQAYIGNEFARWQNPPYAWVDVPDSHVLHRHDNPTGEGVACWADDQIICFVEGNGA